MYSYVPRTQVNLALIANVGTLRATYSYSHFITDPNFDMYRFVMCQRMRTVQHKNRPLFSIFNVSYSHVDVKLNAFQLLVFMKLTRR